jgi:putative PEP-CTERM system histidine kinase
VNTLGAFGYAAVGALYALLAVLLLATGRGRRIGVYLIAAAVASSVWGFTLAAQTAFGSIHPLLVAAAEVTRAATWILFLVRVVSQIGVSRQLSALALLACLSVALGIVYLVMAGPADFEFAVDLGVVMIPGGLAIALFGLVLIEQLYRNSSADARWSLKPLVLGLGGIFAYDMFLYSQGILLNAIDATTWTARGVVNLIFVPMIAIAARRNTDWQIRIFISRQVVFYSTTLTAVGLYLLLMSLGGYLIVLYGGSWGGLAQIVFFAGAVVVLVTMLFSNTLRARLRVFLNKHFFHNKYDYREEWLRLVATLAKFNNSSAREVAVEALAQIVESPSGAIWIRDDVNKVFALNARFETDEQYPDFTLQDPILQFIQEEGWLIDLDEYAREPERYGDMILPPWLQQSRSAWLLVPLMSAGKLLGLILLNKAPGPPRLNFEDRDLLKTVGNHIAVHLSQAKSDELLAEARQFEAYSRLTAFLMHDLNNLIAQQSLIVANAEKHKRNAAFVDDAMATIASSVERMKRVMAQLKAGGSETMAKATELRFLVSAAADRCSGRNPLPTLAVNGVDARVVVDVDEFTMVLTHLIGNAQDACSEGDVVNISLAQSDGHASVTISDTGSGMSQEFIRDRLFRPFDSTKGSQGMGIGAYQAREFARKHGGELVVDSELAKGTTVTMSLPLAGKN